MSGRALVAGGSGESGSAITAELAAAAPGRRLRAPGCAATRPALGWGMDSRRTARLLSAAGLAGGLALLVRPRDVVSAVAPEYPPERLWAVRLLGARLVAQHAVVLVAPRPPVLRAAAAADALHAASMLPLLAVPRYRRAALASGTLAAASAATVAQRGR